MLWSGRVREGWDMSGGVGVACCWVARVLCDILPKIRRIFISLANGAILKYKEMLLKNVDC